MSKSVEEMLVDKWKTSGLLVDVNPDDMLTLSLYLEEAAIYYNILEIRDIRIRSYVGLILPIIRRLFNETKKLNIQEIIKNSEAFLSSDFYKDNVSDIVNLNGDGEAEMLAYFTDNYNKLDHQNKNYFI